jgi:hypothetical protein
MTAEQLHALPFMLQEPGGEAVEGGEVVEGGEQDAALERHHAVSDVTYSRGCLQPVFFLGTLFPKKNANGWQSPLISSRPY